MPLIALTGGIASGKSTVAARLASHGAVVIDADAVAREVVQPGNPVLRQIREAFGEEVLAADGGLDRAALGRTVFADPAARARLESLTHPAIRRRVAELVAKARREDPDAVVVYDVPLLVEGGPEALSGYDLILVVTAEASRRVRRLVTLRGMTRAEAARRVAAQADESARLAVADVVIDANGSLEHTLSQADAAYERIRSLRPAGQASALHDQQDGRQA